MYTKNDLLNDIAAIGIKPDDTLMVHSSMKAIGKVDGGADTVLDAFIEYLKDDGLLLFPTHTWGILDDKNNIFDPKTTPSCVGLLSNMFMKRPQVFRSLHVTHSVAALGKDAYEYVKGEEYHDSPCPRDGCWGKLYDRKAKILFLGCSMKCNTFLHGVEEWNNIPDRIASEHSLFKIKMPDEMLSGKPEDKLFDRPSRRHQSKSSTNISFNYDRVQPLFIKSNAVITGNIGAAESFLGDAVMMADIVTKLLIKNPMLFADLTLE